MSATQPSEAPIHRKTRQELEAIVCEWTDEVPDELFASGDPIDDLPRWEDEGGAIV